jgi:hypothetical protein
MWWQGSIIAVVAVLAFFSWRFRNKALSPGIRDNYSAAHDYDRHMTGGHDVDGNRQP